MNSSNFKEMCGWTSNFPESLLVEYKAAASRNNLEYNSLRNVELLLSFLWSLHDFHKGNIMR